MKRHPAAVRLLRRIARYELGEADLAELERAAGGLAERRRLRPRHRGRTL
ncbi:MAG: hypothetical protein QN193_06585 [Armatimonadota bacterium]|nr:hypothetical protein [Armatimonadota bacterium]MDR7440251.1 hypothetical protein [Armatimonadota bacterium]MDR7444578.1 hypothetical protein [Armatimonadota bacterium]MDR7570256.1 hypothetical protein [Armatimonadota bacterium]MDR7615367.1 hypothetical protein [Armatimonadota bacterium]